MADTNFNITSSNAQLWMIVETIFPAGFALEMFGTDQSAVPDPVDITETRKTLDNKMVAGFVPSIKPVTITLEASSPSRFALSTLFDAMELNMKPYRVTLTATVPSVGEVVQWTDGVLKNGHSAPILRKVLDPTNWLFHFNAVRRLAI